MKISLVEEMRAIDAKAKDEYGIPELVLMENAGHRTAEAVCELLGQPDGKSVIVLAGTGNNGGDAFAAARHLVNDGARVKIFLVGDGNRVVGQDSLSGGLFGDSFSSGGLRCFLGLNRRFFFGGLLSEISLLHGGLGCGSIHRGLATAAAHDTLCPFNDLVAIGGDDVNSAYSGSKSSKELYNGIEFHGINLLIGFYLARIVYPIPAENAT